MNIALSKSLNKNDLSAFCRLSEGNPKELEDEKKKEADKGNEADQGIRHAEW
ncbi:MAG: hypothetical protein U5K54_01935 [Cytophagales bacterium]|nr:hypothetical protein [Cytophagales bacterium]